MEMSECSAIATFLAGRKLSRIGIDSDRSSISTVARPDQVLGALDLEVVGVQAHRRAAARATDRVADGALDVEVERVAELVGLGVVGRARGRRRCGSISWRPSLVRGRACENSSASAFWPMRRMPLGVSSSRPSLLLDQPGLLEHAGPARPCARGSRPASSPSSSRARSRSTSASAPGLVAPRSRLLELVEVAQLAAAAASASRHAERVLAVEVVAAVPAHVRERPGAGSGRAGRSASAGPCPRAAGRTSAWSWARCSGVIELSIACMAAMRRAMSSSSSSRVCGVLREEVAVALHEAVEVGLLARGRAARASG